MQLVSFAAFLLAAALPVIAKVMLGGGLRPPFPLLSSSIRRRLSQRRTTADRSICPSPLVCPKTPVMQAAPDRSPSRCATPAVSQSSAVRFREPFGTSSPGEDDDDTDYSRPETPFQTPYLRPQSPKSRPQTSSNFSVNSASRGRRVSYWDNPYSDPSYIVAAAAGSGRRSVPTITILEVRDGVVVKREAEDVLAQEEAPAHQRYPQSPYPAKYPQSPFVPQYPKSPYPSKYPQPPYPGNTTDQGTFHPSSRDGVPTESRGSLLAVADQGADLIERAATWAAERGVDTNVGLEDFEERSYLGRAIRKLRGTSRREKQESARAHVVREARKNWAARSLDATHHWAARGLDGTHHLAHRGLEGVEAVGRGAVDGLDAVRRGAAGALRPRSESRSGREGEPFPHAENVASSSPSSSRQSSPSPRRRVLHKSPRMRDVDDADLACMATEAMVVSAADSGKQSAGRRFSLGVKSLKDLGRRTRSGTDSSTRSSASDPGSRTRSGSESSADERHAVNARRVSLPWNRMK